MRGKQGRGLTIGEWLGHIVEEANLANILGVKVNIGVIADNSLDVTVPVGDVNFHVDGASVIPEDYFGLKKLIAEVDTDVEIARDDNGEPVGLSLLMKRNLIRRGSRVKFRVELGRSGTVEAFNILKDAANSQLTKEAARAGIEIKSQKKGDN